MSDHLTRERIYAYLDGELSGPERRAVQAHLSGCEGCRQQVASVEGLYRTIEQLPDEELAVDLAPRVLGSLERKARWLPRLALGQLLIALAVGLALLVGLGSATVSSRITQAAQQFAIDVQAVAELALTTAADSVPEPGSLRFEIGSQLIAPIAGAALALWALSNGLALRRISGRNRA